MQRKPIHLPAYRQESNGEQPEPRCNLWHNEYSLNKKNGARLRPGSDIMVYTGWKVFIACDGKMEGNLFGIRRRV